MKHLIQELAQAKVQIMELQRQLAAAKAIIKTLTKRLAEKELKK